MDDIFVARLMSSTLHTADPDTLVEDAANTMLDNEVGSVLVVGDDGKIVGILTSSDFVGIVAASKPKAQTTVERYMSTDVTATTAQTSIQDAADAMVEHGIHHLPVVEEDGSPIGMLSSSDLTAYLSREEDPTPA
jgi:CBS domain-containing protein